MVARKRRAPPRVPDVKIEATSLIAGEPLVVTLARAPTPDYQQIQVEAITAGVANPSLAIAIGTSPNRREGGAVGVSMETGSLMPGLYEVARVRLHSPTKVGIPEAIDFICGRDSPRRIFEIRQAD